MSPLANKLDWYILISRKKAEVSKRRMSRYTGLNVRTKYPFSERSQPTTEFRATRSPNFMFENLKN